MRMSEFGAPEGSYTARFLGVGPPQDATPRQGRDGKTMPPPLAWEWEITEDPENNGKYVGIQIGRVTSQVPTGKNSCGTLLRGILGRMPGQDEDVEPNDFKGRLYIIVVGPTKDDADKTYVVGCRPKGAAAPVVRPSGDKTPPPKGGPPPPRPPARRFWVVIGEGSEPELVGATALARTIKELGLDADSLLVCPDGGSEWVPASKHGFADPIPF